MIPKNVLELSDLSYFYRWKEFIHLLIIGKSSLTFLEINMTATKRKFRQIGTAYKTNDPDIMRIDIFPEYSDGLERIEELENIDIYYWMHRLDEEDREKLKVHPQGNKNKPLTGVFALRSPVRPNPFGETKVELVRREGNSLFVKGLDAFDKSPIIDIKHG